MRHTEDRIADQRWLNEGGSFSRYPDHAEEIEMTDVRRSSPHGALPTRRDWESRSTEGEVDGIWQRASHIHLAEQVRLHPDLPGAEFFEKSLTINPAEIKFRFVASASLLPGFLDMIESPSTNPRELGGVLKWADATVRLPRPMVGQQPLFERARAARS